MSGGEPSLAALLRRVERGELGDPLPLLAYIAGQRLELPPDELNAARRRSLLLRAAAGDPRAEPGLDDPATRRLALDLFSDSRRAALGAALDELVPLVRELPALREAVLFLAADLDLAWRLLMLALLAEEPDEEAV